MLQVATSKPRTSEPARSERYAGLVGSRFGSDDSRPSLVLLHGLTYDSTMWAPALHQLALLDPDRQVLALDLPGHGRSDPRPTYPMDELVSEVHAAVEAADLSVPVVVGHSASGIIATFYAAHHATSAVVNVDQPLYVKPFAELIQPAVPLLDGPQYAQVWEMNRAGMRIDLLPEPARQLLDSTSTPTRDLLVGYWRDVIDRSPAQLQAWLDSAIADVRTTRVPYLVIAGDDLEPAYREWLATALPQARITVLPRSGHFPHLAHPQQFAALLASTAHSSTARP